MSSKKNNGKGNKLGRRKFDDIITDAYMDYLFGDAGHDINYLRGDDFCPLDTPNRNPLQVKEGIWKRILFKHVHKHFYN